MIRRRRSLALVLALAATVAACAGETASADEALPDDLAELRSNPKQLDAVMTSFTTALGTTCEGCHAKVGEAIDFEADTPRKRVASKMWTRFVRGLRHRDGSAVTCESCHKGKMEILDRSDHLAVGIWMKRNFVTDLERRDGQTHDCTTCHGEPFDRHFLDEWRN